VADNRGLNFIYLGNLQIRALSLFSEDDFRNVVLLTAAGSETTNAYLVYLATNRKPMRHFFIEHQCFYEIRISSHVLIPITLINGP
jgi:hypothetical protein